jgi:hypothetical protein
MIRIKTSMMEIEKTLGIIPLTDPEVVTIQVEPPKTDVVRVDVEDFQ